MSSQAMWWVVRAWLLVALAVVVGCSSGDPKNGYQAGPGQFGDPCQKTEDCASGLCVQLDANSGVCSRTCLQDASCPASSNWGCVPATNIDLKVCACLQDSSTEVCGDGADNDCNGLVDDCQMCNGKPIPADDPYNCGECGNVCRVDQICSLGSCKCPPGTAFECAGKCVDLDTNALNCGSCGNACPVGQSCQSGACSCPDAFAQDYCEGTGCLNLQSDDYNCGACGTQCPYGTTCSAGVCTCADATKPDYCAASGCVDLQTDAANCGICGNGCNAAQSCVNGACVCNVAGNVECGSTCVNLNSDANNCGSCGNVCSGGKNCAVGTCTCPTITPNECNSQCTNVANDKANCGACGIACPSYLACQGGTCECPYVNQIVCNGACVYPLTDENNCGSCGTVCPAGQTCTSGACKCSTYGLTVCGVSCVDTKTDPNNCGSCGTVCPATQICSSSTCKCPTGQTWCAAANACVDLKTDTNNCGACSNVCNPGEACSNGSCACPASGEKWCASSGVCTDTLANTNHCGACDNACNPSEVCQGGYCKCATNGEKWCASTGTCTDIANNSSHCGACDKVCPAGTQCQSYSCKCLTAGQTLCGTACYDLQNDPAHCGYCANACTGNQTCTAGKCGCPAAALGPPIRLTTTSTDTTVPAVAWNGTHAGVVYMEDPPGPTSGPAVLYFALLNPDGTRAKTPDVELATTASPSKPANIVWTGSEFGVVWIEGSSVLFRRLAADGTPQAAAVNITASTVGTKLPTIRTPEIAWSSVYGGYALCGLTSSLLLQRIGATGVTPEAANAIESAIGSQASMVASPSGEWGILMGGSFARAWLVIVNPDGSKTKPTSELANTPLYPFPAQVALTHDGSTWLSAWRDTNGPGIYVNRGEVKNNPYVAVSVPSGMNGVNFALAPSGSGAVEIVWTQPNDIRMRRFLVPATSSSVLTPLGSEVAILATQNAIGLSVVHMGSGSLLAAWPDNRWGAPELYAEPVDFSNCP